MTWFFRSIVHSNRRWFNWMTALLVALLISFSIAIGNWGLLLADMVLHRNDRGTIFIVDGWQAIPAFALFTMCAVLLLQHLYGGPNVWRNLIFLLFSAAVFFAMDVYFGRWQLDHFYQSKWYWDSGGKWHDYFTWWWFDDLWFMWLFAKLDWFVQALGLADSIGLCVCAAFGIWLIVFPDTVATAYMRLSGNPLHLLRVRLTRFVGGIWILLLMSSIVIALRIGEYPTENLPGQLPPVPHPDQVYKD